MKYSLCILVFVLFLSQICFGQTYISPGISVSQNLEENDQITSISFEIKVVVSSLNKIGLSTHFSLGEDINRKYFLFDGNFHFSKTSPLYIGLGAGVIHLSGKVRSSLSPGFTSSESQIKYAFAPSLGFNQDIDFRISFLLDESSFSEEKTGLITISIFCPIKITND